MSKFGNVNNIQAVVGGRTLIFRAKLEYRWAVWCQFRKEQEFIKDWWYESGDTLLELKTKRLGNKKLYLPDFCIQTNDGNYEFEETKGYFSPKDYGKMKLSAQQYDNPITLIFANLPDNSTNKKTRAQYSRAKKLEPYLKRIIYHANRDIFKPIIYLMEF